MPGSDAYSKDDIRRLSTWRFPAITFNADQRRHIAARAIQVIKARMIAAMNVEDQPAAHYSPRGPIYVPLTYGAITQQAGGVRAIIQPARSVRQLRGAYSLKRTEYLQKLGNMGYNVKVGGRVLEPYRSLKSAKFANYQEFKQFIGHSGERDLELSGRMLGYISFIEESETEIVIGFLNAEQEAKMRGNQKWERMWGFSPNDKANILPIIEAAINENLGKLFFP